MLELRTIKVDCSDYREGDPQPTLVLNREDAKTGTGKWWVAGSYAKEEPHAIDWNVVTDASDYLTIPLFSYVSTESYESMLLSGVEIGRRLFSSESIVSLGTPSGVILATGGTVGLVNGRIRFWLGIAIKLDSNI